MIHLSLAEKTKTIAVGEHFAQRIQAAIHKSQQNNRPFFILALQLENFQLFKKRRSRTVVSALSQELFQVVRMALHSSQYVGLFQDGLGLVFEMTDVNHVDQISQKLVIIAQNVTKAGKYNDLTSRWTDIIYQFLWPNKPDLLIPKVGWAIYPRDGATPYELAKRALYHSSESRSR